MLEGLQRDQLPQQLHGSRRELQCCAHMEAVTQALDAGGITNAQKHLTAAEQCLGVSSEVTGKLSAEDTSGFAGRLRAKSLSLCR